MFVSFTTANNNTGATQQPAFSSRANSTKNGSAVVIMDIARAVSIFVIALLGIIIGIINVAVLLSLVLILVVLVLVSLIITTSEYRLKGSTP